MATQEKVENLIKEGIKHPLPAGITDAATLDKYLRNHTNTVASELKECFRDYTDTVASTHEELTCEIREQVREHMKKHDKPFYILFVKIHTYVTYRGTKIPTKGLYNQSKNKFISRVCKKVITPPIKTNIVQDLNDKYRFVMDLIFCTEE